MERKKNKIAKRCCKVVRTFYKNNAIISLLLIHQTNLNKDQIQLVEKLSVELHLGVKTFITSLLKTLYLSLQQIYKEFILLLLMKETIVLLGN